MKKSKRRFTTALTNRNKRVYFSNNSISPSNWGSTWSFINATPGTTRSKSCSRTRAKLRGVFHCFGGSLEQANEVLDLDHLVSFTGIVTFKNGAAVREVAAQVPLWKFMVETDCPYLAPVPFRGKRCEPAHTRIVAEAIAAARQVPLEEIAEATTETAEKFFRFNRNENQEWYGAIAVARRGKTAQPTAQ